MSKTRLEIEDSVYRQCLLNFDNEKSAHPVYIFKEKQKIIKIMIYIKMPKKLTLIH